MPEIALSLSNALDLDVRAAVLGKGGPKRLVVEFADREAARLNISRSRVIARALSEVKAEEEARLAAEGYRFYAQEASEFAEVSAAATAEALAHGV